MQDFNALILAAGVGSRLAPLTDRIPKSLVPVNGQPVLFRQIENLLANGIDRITVVTGYLADILQAETARHYPQVTFVNSPDYAVTNNMYSAYLAHGHLQGAPLLMMNADVFFNASVIADLIAFPAPNAIVTDLNSYNQESMKVTASQGRIDHISKDIPSPEALGTSIDVYKLSLEAVNAFFAQCRHYIEELHQRNRWSEVALNDILAQVPFQPCPLHGPWYEIDTLEDLHHAEQLFR